MDVVENFIDGKLAHASNDESHSIYNPATGEVIKEVYYANANEVEAAIQAAEKAFKTWKNVTPLKRARVLFKFKELLEKHSEELANIITSEHGKVLEDARGEILRAIELVEYMCGIPNLLKGNYSQNVGTGIDCYTIRQPLGVCVGITPFNYPVMISCWMFVSAIACGNTFVLKPSEKDPSAPILLAQLMQKAGLPNGVFNVVNGDKRVVEQLITHNEVKAVSCVGSSTVSEIVYKTAIEHGKRAHTFGSGKNHCVVMPNCEIDEAVKAVMGAAYGSAGERCMAVSVAVAVGDETADLMIKKIQEKIPNLKVGSGKESGMDMGPLISKEHWERVKSYIDLGVNEGAKLIIDGRDAKTHGQKQGFFMGPSLFDKVQPNMRIYQEEIFGPVLEIVRVKNLDEAIDLINQHTFGNGTAIFTNSGEAARRFADEVQVGMVGINVPTPVPVAYHAFGGWKRSLFGDIQMHGPESIMFYTKSKSITTHWPREAQDTKYHMPSQ